MTDFPHNLYTSAQVREMDRMAVQDYQLAGIELMERAGAAAFSILQQRWPEVKNISICCGTGNNGGDGFVIARLAHENNYQVRVFQVGNAQNIKGDALLACQRCQQAGVSIEQLLDPEQLVETELFVDALLGTGFHGEVKGEFIQAIKLINHHQAVVFAVDVPSGLDADTGHVAGQAVMADCTVTFIGMKRGLLTGMAMDYCGEVLFDDLQIPSQVLKQQLPVAQHCDYDEVKHHLVRRKCCAHKGDYGHVLVVGGNTGMPGAARMAGEAALRCGAGLVSIACQVGQAVSIGNGRPELMCHEIKQEAQLQRLLKKASVVVIGPGLGESDWAADLYQAVLASSLALVLDADALNLLAKNPAQHDNWVLTPHPGEAARLLHSNTQAIQANRFDAARQLVQQYRACVVLKGAGSLVADTEQSVTICRDGNPGMASGGMGDVLSGLVGGLIAQGIQIPEAARLAVAVHARAGDLASQEHGERGLLAMDLMDNIHRLVNP